ncbi:MAG: OmpA family protein [Saprospiraceae bacterium]
MKLIELQNSSMKQMKAAHLLILLLGMVSMECKNEANKSIKKISQVEIEKDSSYLYTHTLNSTTKKALETLGQTPMVEGNLGNQLTTFIKDGIYDYGEIFKFIELRWKNNSSELIQKSRTEIDELAKVMMLFPNMTIKMECYTDNNGDAKKLEKISQERVEYIKKEVVASGVSPERINIKGFGSKYPVGDNKIMEGQLINNRIEITILKLF